MFAIRPQGGARQFRDTMGQLFGQEAGWGWCSRRRGRKQNKRRGARPRVLSERAMTFRDMCDPRSGRWQQQAPPAPVIEALRSKRRELQMLKKNKTSRLYARLPRGEATGNALAGGSNLDLYFLTYGFRTREHPDLQDAVFSRFVLVSLHLGGRSKDPPSRLGGGESYLASSLWAKGYCRLSMEGNEE